jgi:two-component system, NarL family, response regulator DevR
MNPLVFSSSTNALPATHHQRVLIVDDHEIFRHGLRDLIHMVEGFEVVAEGGSCEDALTLVRQMHIDLVILDMYLPDGNGIQTIRQLKREMSNPPCVIILSAMMDNETLVDAMLAGAEGYLTKDIPASDILNALKGFQCGQLALSHSVTTRLVHLLVQKFSEKEAELSSYMHNGITATASSSLETENIHTPAILSNTSSPMLTQQEARVFELLRCGRSNKQIASQLAISPYTVGKHVQKILRKLGVTNRTQAALYTSFEGGGYIER